MADATAKSTLDAESNMNDFMKWVQKFSSSNLSPAGAKVVVEDIQKASDKYPSTNGTVGEPEQKIQESQDGGDGHLQEITDHQKPRVLFTDEEDGPTVDPASKSNPAKNGSVDENSAQKTVNNSTHGSVNNLDQASSEPPAGEMFKDESGHPDPNRAHKLAAKRAIVTRVAQGRERSRTPQDFLSNSDKEQSLMDGKSEGMNHESGQQHHEWVASTAQKAPREPQTEENQSKKVQGLRDSIHARSSIRISHPKAFHGPPSLQHASEEAGEQHDTMKFFDDKRKEYWPPGDKFTETCKPALQSKDPNTLMKSPKKKTAKLNPLAEEYTAAVGAKRPGNKSAQWIDMAASLEAFTVKDEERVPEMVLADVGDEPLSADNEAVVNKTTSDDDAPSETHPLEKPDHTLTDPSCEGQSTQQPDKKFDLTPMLNVLGARATNPPEITPSQQSDAEPPVATKIEDSPVTPAVQVLKGDEANEKTLRRTLILSNLPEDSNYTLVQSLVHKAAIISMELMREEHCARVKLTDANDCQRLVESQANGVTIKHNGKDHTILMEVSSEVEEHDDVIEAYLDFGATRVVQVENVDMDVTMRALHQTGSGAKSSREVEAINDMFSGGQRRVVFRFISIHDAVAFRSALRRNGAWKEQKIEFIADPCAS